MMHTKSGYSERHLKSGRPGDGVNISVSVVFEGNPVGLSVPPFCNQ